MRIFTLLTDFGTRDGYVAAMKGVILGICPEAQLVDISHEVPPQDVRTAAFVLFTVYQHFPPGTIHIAVVDPGVGTDRKALGLRASRQFFVGPDNGLFSFILKRETLDTAHSLENPTFWKEPVSQTFHGRDIFAPVAAHLGRGIPLESMGPQCTPGIEPWSSPHFQPDEILGEAIHVDHFGNIITNITPGDLKPQAALEAWRIQAGGNLVPVAANAYAQTPPGTLMAYWGSSGFLEIAISRGNAAHVLGILPGERVVLHRDS